jgi:D-threo-aldose 1-dehydrogenase
MRDFGSHVGLGRTSLKLGPIGLGLAPIGNLYAPVSEAQALATLAAAQQRGLGWFDVAPLYGHGLAERRLGRYLKESAAATPLVSTKVGRLLRPASDSLAHNDEFVAPLPLEPAFDYSPEGIERSYTESLQRMGLPRTQILLLHDVDRLHHPTTHRTLVRQLLNEALPTLARFKSEDRVDAIGLGINEWDIGYEILASAPVDCVLLAGRYTLLDSSSFVSGFLDACARCGVSVLAGGVFNSGFLAGGDRYGYRKAEVPLLERREQLSRICDRHRVPLAAAALQFTAAHPAITSIVVGARSAAEVEAIVGWTRAHIPEELWQDLRSVGLIPSEAPTPKPGPQESPKCG